MNTPSFTDYLRAIDDSDLDTYEIRYLLRVWRRGKCWETVRKTEATTKGFSTASISRVRRQLVEKGWLTMTEANGKIAYEVAIPNVVVVTQSNSVVTESNNLVTDRRTLPLIEQKEDHNIKGNGAGVFDDEQEATRQAVNAVLSLVDFWQDLTKRNRPANEQVFRETWFRPFNTIWITCGRDVDAAKEKVQAVRASMLERGMTILDPSKLPAHVQSLVDAELLSMTKLFSGNGATPDAPTVDTLWSRTINAVTAGLIDDPRLKAAVKAIGGSAVIRQANEFTTPKLKGRLFDEYQRVATAS